MGWNEDITNLLCGFHLSIIGTDELTLSSISFGCLVIAASHWPSLAEAVWRSVESRYGHTPLGFIFKRLIGLVCVLALTVYSTMTAPVNTTQDL